jgi:phosphatidylglycerol---prolipoprotein diacylglyceryl transferase
MLPSFTLFGYEVHLYGLMIAAGVGAGVLIAWRFPVKKGIPGQDIVFACCFAGIGALLGAKLLYLAVTIPQILRLPNPPALSWALVTELLSGGFIFYGGVFGGLAGVLIYSRMYKIGFPDLLETIVPSVPLAHAIGRIGCFCAGCCYGLPTQPPWGVYFCAGSVAPWGVALLPVQLYETALNLVLFAVLFVYSRKNRGKGRILGLYLAGYGLERFVLEFFRYDAIRGVFFGLSTSQWISLVLIPLGVYFMLRPAFKKNIAV